MKSKPLPEGDGKAWADNNNFGGQSRFQRHRVDIVGFDWNCPKHITPRFTAEEVEEATAPLQTRIAELEAALAKKNS